MWSSGTLNRWCASITSRPLFIKVAESTVTFGPIDHLGWFSACSTVTWSRSSSGCAQNGPPLAVRIRRRTDSRLSPQRHCQIALCSESTGRMPSAPAAFITSSPAMTSTSLVASATCLPAFSAAMVGAREGDHHQVTARVGDHRLDPRIEFRVARLALHDVLRGSPRRPATFGQAEQAQPRGVAIDDVERLLTDRTGRAEHGDVAGDVGHRRWNNVT